MADALLSLLANRSNQAILGLLAVEPAYPRKVGQLLSLSETEVSRRLKRMEENGLVLGEWHHVGKNVKMYRLAAAGAGIRFSQEGVEVTLDKTEDTEAPTQSVIPPVVSDIPEVEGFIGRGDDLAALAGSEGVVIVEGLAGIGKTSLLAKYGRSLDGTPVFWHGFRGSESLRWLANRLAVFHGQHGDRSLLEALDAELEPADLHDLIVRALNTKGFVHILDDVDRAEDTLVRDLLRSAVRDVKTGQTIVAGRAPPRHDPSLEHVTVLTLGGLDDEDVAQFLKDRAADIDAALMPRLREEVGGHPLALTLFLEVASRPDMSADALLDRIPEDEIESWLLREVYDGLTDGERQMLTLASLFRGAFHIDDLRALTRRDPERIMFKLRRRGIVSPAENQLLLHEVVRNFFYNLLQDKPRLHEKAARRLLDRDTTEGRLEAMFHLLAANKRERVLELLEDDLDLRAFDFIDASYHNLYQEVLESFTEKEVKDPKRWALIEDEKGDIAYHRADYKNALEHYATAMAAFDPTEDAERVADLCWKRGLAFAKLGKAKDAEKSCAQGLEIAPEDGVSRERLDELRESL